MLSCTSTIMSNAVYDTLYYTIGHTPADHTITLGLLCYKGILCAAALYCCIKLALRVYYDPKGHDIFHDRLVAHDQLVRAAPQGQG